MILRKFFPNSWFDKYEPLEDPLHLHTFDSDIACESMVYSPFGVRRMLNGHVLMCSCGRWKWFPR